MKLRLSADTLSAVLDSIQAHIAVLDSTGTILAVNGRWVQFASENGLTQENAGIGLNYIAVCEASRGPNSDYSREVAASIRAILAGDAQGFEIDYPCHAPGQKRWFRLIASPITLDGGLGAVATHINITDQAVAEELLRKNRDKQLELAERLRAEQEALSVARTIAQMGSWETDLRTLEVRWTPETFGIFEVNGKGFEPTHDAFLSFVHPDDRSFVQRAFLESLGTREVQSIDHRILLPDGRIKYLTQRWKTVVDESGTPIRAMGTCQDITEREIASQRLRDSEAKLRRSQEIFSTAERVASIGAVALDFRTGLWEWSDEAYRIYGLDPDQFTPSLETFPSLIHPDDRDALLGAIPLARQGITPPPMEYRIIRPDGTERLLRREATLARGPGGEILGIVGTLQDITDVRANERERELLQERIREGQRLEAIGQMTGGIAHDFNNLLTVILGNAEVLGRNLPKASPLQEMVDLTRLAAGRGAQLTNRLLAFSRRQTLAPKALDVNALVQNMESILRRALGEGISFLYTGNESLWPCYADDSQLENALLNLVVNARDAMPRGGRLTIEASNLCLRAEDQVLDASGDAPASIPPGDYVKIAVTDTGCGMTEETRQHAFEPFFTTKDVGKGSGLGLSMVYGFIRQSGGQVEISSEIGVGTSVILSLPRATGSVERDAGAAGESLIVGGTEHILVVEDDDLVRRQSVVNLRSLGYRVTDARDGIEALELLKSGKTFDLLFTDMVMPRGINGRQLAEAASTLCPDMPVLYTSGYAEEHITRESRPGIGLTLLRKPYNAADLARKVRDILGFSRSRNGPGGP
jgi:PAS domain S-box-containing protein